MNKYSECDLCSGDVTEADYCYGCSEYVCQECIVDDGSLSSMHNVEDHLLGYVDSDYGDHDEWDADFESDEEPV